MGGPDIENVRDLQALLTPQKQVFGPPDMDRAQMCSIIFTPFWPDQGTKKPSQASRHERVYCVATVVRVGPVC